MDLGRIAPWWSLGLKDNGRTFSCHFFFPPDGRDLGETAQLGLTLFFLVASLSLFDDLAAPV